MNLPQLMRKARFNADALLPGGTVSSLWSDEELADLVTEADEEINRRFRLVHKKWGLQTVKQSDSAFVREGETYTPSTALQITSTQSLLTLPPDFGEVVRILCLNDRTVRFQPAQMESFHWIDLEQASQDDAGTPLGSVPSSLTFYFDIIAARTLSVIPVTSGTYNLQVDYIPMKRPLYYSNTGTVAVTNGQTAVAGTGTTWVTDGVFSEASGQWAELLVGFTSLSSSSVSLQTDYPRVASIASNTALTLKSAYGGTTNGAATFLLAMAPALPREYHRWIAAYTSALMLGKVSPDLATQYSASVEKRFSEAIRPAAGQRQSQESPITEDADEFGSASWR